MRRSVLCAFLLFATLLPFGAPVSIGASALAPVSLSAGGGTCTPLPAPTGPTVTVSNEADIRDRAAHVATGTTILIQSGTYYLADTIYITNQGITLRGASGDREDVILDLGGMGGGLQGIWVGADDVTIADLTLRNTGNTGVEIQGVDRPLLYNLHILDTNDQLVKVNPVGDGSDDGTLACSLLEYTTSAPDDYTNGISAHDAHGWTVRDNEWRRIRGNADETGPTILFWSGSSDTIVERNLLVDCYRGIAFGNASHGAGDHTGGVVRNNFIYFSLMHDTAIEMVHAQNWVVANNSVLLINPAAGLTWGIEARYADSSGTFFYNLTNMDVLPDRDGAAGAQVGNLTNAGTTWFVNAAGADLHLVATATDAIDHAAPLALVTDDYDADARPIGPAPDVGADEYGVPPPTGIDDLRVGEVTSSPGSLSVELLWTPPDDAVACAVRRAGERITEANWETATLLTGALAGTSNRYVADFLYAGGTVYFGIKYRDGAGEWSSLSNIAFWPYEETFLPLIFKE